MSQGPHKELEATVVKPAAEQPTQPNWNVQHKEVLDHIRQERVPQAEVKAVAQVQTPPQQVQHRTEVHPPVAQAQGQTPPHRIEVHPPVAQVPPQHPVEVRPLVAQTQPQVRHDGTSQPIASANNQNKHLYGGLAGGALLGGGAAYYANRDSYGYGYGRDYDSGLNLNLGPVDQYSQYGQYDQYALYNNATSYNDQYLNGNQYSDNGQYYDPDNGGNDYINGGTTYGGTRFDNGFVSRPIYASTDVDGYPPPYGYDRRNSFGDNPIAAVPALFGNLIGGILGNLTNPHHRRYDNDDI